MRTPTSPQKAAALAAELNKAGATLLAAAGDQETGYWNPAIVTGADGKATVTVTVPERSTAWKLLAKGITTETLAGETTERPDRQEGPLRRVEAAAGLHRRRRGRDPGVGPQRRLSRRARSKSTLKTTIGGRTVEEKKTIEVDRQGHPAS